jgi:hypothetical protein
MSTGTSENTREFYLVQRNRGGFPRVVLAFGQIEGDIEIDVIRAASWKEARSKIPDNLFNKVEGYGLVV